MDSVNVVGSNGNLSTNPATIPGEGHHSVSGKLLNTLPSSSSESSSDGSNQFGLVATPVAPFSTDWPQTLNDNNGTGSLRPESNQTFPVVEPGLRSTTNSDLTTSPSTALAEDDFSATTKNLGPLSSSTATFFDDPFQLHTNGTRQTTPPVSTSGSSKLDEDNGLGLLERISVKEPGHESETSTDMWTYTGTSFNEGDPSTQAMKLSESPTSSSAADFSSKNPFEVSAILDSTGPQRIENTKLSSDNIDDNIPESDLPKNEESPSAPPAVLGHHSELSTSGNTETQSPPVQVMERPGDANTPEYKLPSYVFARTSTTAPMEWSVTSNESLFSIHMGNMSFTGDQLYFLGKSGELGKPGDPGVSPLIDFSSNQPPPREKSTDTGQKNGNLDEGLGATEAKAAETMREVIRENAENQKKEDEFLAKGATLSAVPSPSSGTSPSASLSNHSEGSTKSFAFPILAGDDEKSLSMRSGAQKQTQQQPPPTQSQPVTPKETPAEASDPKATENVAPAKWLSCFSCCPFCS